MIDNSKTERKRVLFVGEAVSLAHVLRPFELFSGLDSGAYDACFACDPRVLPLLEVRADRYRPLNSIPSEHFQKRLATGSAIYKGSELAEYAQDELRLLAELEPDVVVGDFRITLSISAELMGIPYICLSQAHWSPDCARSYPMPDLPVVRALGARVCDPVFRVFRPMGFALYTREFNKLRRSFDLDPVGSLPEMYTRGTCTLYLDLPELSPVRHLPHGHRYIGPLMAEPQVPLPAWHDRIHGRDPVIYVSVGSSGDPRAMAKVMAALSELPATILLSTAGRFDASRLPDNCYAAEYLPGSWAVSRSDVVVCNGGSGTVYQAIAQGKPVLGVPSNMDQYFIMGGVVEAGAGLMARASQVNSRQTCRLIDRLLREDSFRVKTGELAVTLRAWDTIGEFQSALKEVLVEHGRLPAADAAVQVA